jgi:SAM-dependent methyltransferase
MIYRIQHDEEFKSENLQNWKMNTHFWLQGRMRHLSDVHDMTGDILGVLLSRELSHRPVVLDIGCGEGWLLRLIKEKQYAADYIGLDFNQEFIDTLKVRYSGDENVRFVLHDIEKAIPAALAGTVDIVTNCFNFFEVPDVNKAFHNAAVALRPGGILLVLTIDPIIQLISISKSLEELTEALRQYERCPTDLAYDKEIDIGDGGSGRIYKGILYSAATYVQIGKRAGLKLTDFQELVRTAKRNPQIYQYLLFQK